MNSIVAISSNRDKSYSLVPPIEANSYCSAMSRDRISDIRRQNLLVLHNKFSWEQIANASGTNAQYLSQIANGVIQKGGKTPRSLSNDYATKIENGLRLGEGWFDQDRCDEHAPPTSPDNAHDDLKDLIERASPRSRAQLERIAKAAASGQLSDDDVALLETIAKRLSK